MNPVFGKLLIFIGLLLVFAGIVYTFNIHIPFLGKLPGDITIKRDHFQFFFPLTTSILISILFSLLLALFRK